MNCREIIPLKQKPNWEVTLPGSKSITNRVFLCAALAKGKSRIYGALESDDTIVMLNALKKLGVSVIKSKKQIIINGGKLKSGNVTVDAGASGTTTRFLTALSVLRKGKTTIKGIKRMKERPLGDLNDAIGQISKFQALNSKQVQSSKFKTQTIKIKGNKSSQFLSALLMISPYLDSKISIEVIGELVSKPYIDITIAVMRVFGVKVVNDSYKTFEIKPQAYKAIDYHVEGDASAASYWTSIAYLHGGKVKFTNLNKKSVQGDVLFPQALQKLGKVIDMNSMSDVAMTLSVTAPFTKDQTKITGLSTLRLKETDRLAALESELKKVGVKVRTSKESITIQGHSGKQLSPVSCVLCPIKTYNDHRMAMCFAVVGTMIPGVVIEDPNCVDKTYPNFWNDLELAYLSQIKLGKKNLILTGMRCSGKTYLGKKIARHLNRKFVDLDIEIEKQEKMKIAEIVKSYSWSRFRDLEQEMCSQFGSQKNLIIATGGGVVIDPINMRVLKKNGVNVFIFADTSTLVERIKKQLDVRPSLTGKKVDKELVDTWKERRDLYLKYSDYIWDDTSGMVLVKNLKNIFN